MRRSREVVVLPGAESGDEELVTGGSPRRAVQVVVLACVLLFAVAFGYFLSRTHATSPAAQHSQATSPSSSAASSVSTAGVLVPSGFNGRRVDADRITYTAELINTSPTGLIVAYPLYLSASGRGDVIVLYAELAAKNQTGWMSGLEPPPRLTHIAAHQHVMLWIGLRASCAARQTSSMWPTAQTTIAIPLAGFHGPATFTFADLFHQPDYNQRYLPAGDSCGRQTHS